MKVELDEKTRKHFRDIEFVESASTNSETQSALLESLNEDRDPDKWAGPFDSVEAMSSSFEKEMEEQGYLLNRESGYYEKKA